MIAAHAEREGKPRMVDSSSRLEMSLGSAFKVREFIRELRSPPESGAIKNRIRLMMNTSDVSRDLLFAIHLRADGRASAFPDKFTNLKALPKDISKRELESTMPALPSRSACAAITARRKKTPEKGLTSRRRQGRQETARVMLQMVAAVNHDYISKVIKAPPDTPAIQVQCVTCITA